MDPHAPAIEQDDAGQGRCSPRRKAWAWRVAKFALVVLLVCGLVFGGSKFEGLLEKARDDLREQSLVLMIVTHLSANLVRKLVPPLYFLFPLGTVSLLYFADKLGVDEGSLVYQALKAQDILFFVLIRALYTNAVTVLFGLSDKEAEKHRFFKWLSPDFRAALRGLDRLWGRVFDSPRPEALEDGGGSSATNSPASRSSQSTVYRQQRTRVRSGSVVGESSNVQRLRRVALVVVWGVALYMEDYVNLFWLATRSGMSWPLFVFAHVLSMVVEYPKTRIKFQVALAVSDVSTGVGSWKDILSNLGDTAWYTITCVLVIGGLATIFVHGLHIRLVLTSFFNYCAKRCCPSRSGVDNPQDRGLDRL